MSPRAADILAEARQELDREDHRRLVEAAKQTIRNNRGRSVLRRALDRVFPFTVTVTRKNT